MKLNQKNLTKAILIGLITILSCLIGLLILISREFYSTVNNYAQIDYAIVLGAGLEKDQVSERLKRRLDTAYEALKDNDIPIIVSGGKGEGELISEAEAMKAYLSNLGIEEKRILLEDKSTSTYENLKLSSKLLTDKGNRILIITSDYHMFRAKMIGKRLGWKVEGVSAVNPVATRWYLMKRETLAVIKDMFYYRN